MMWFWWILFAVTTACVFLLSWLICGLECAVAIGIAGSWASVFGIIYTFVQVVKVKSTAGQIKDAVAKSNNVILNINSIQDLSESYQIAVNIPNYIHKGQLDCAMLRMADLLKSLGAIQASKNIPEGIAAKCEPFCQKLISDIKSLNANITTQSSIDLEYIMRNVVELIHFLNITNNQLKSSAYDVTKI